MQKGTSEPKKIVIVQEIDSYGPPLDFSFKTLKELSDILKEPARKGKRKPIIIENDKKDDKKKEMNNIEDVNTQKTNLEDDEKVEEDDDGDKAEGENKGENEQKEKDKADKEEFKPKEQNINIIAESRLPTIIQANNHPLPSLIKGGGNKGPEENKFTQKKQAKINLHCTSLFLCYNEIRDLNNFRNIIDRVMYQCDRLTWIDISHNYLTKITADFQLFKQLRTLNLHANYINEISEFENLRPIETLRNLTVHGNPIDSIPNFRLYILGIVPQLTKLDTVLVTKKEKDNTGFFNQTFRRYPKVEKPKYPPEKDKPKQSDQSE